MAVARGEGPPIVPDPGQGPLPGRFKFAPGQPMAFPEACQDGAKRGRVQHGKVDMQAPQGWARLRAWLAAGAADPALALAQYRAFSGQIPLMYVILLANIWGLAAGHAALAPAWLTVVPPLLVTPVCLYRCLVWWRARGRQVDAQQARAAVATTIRLAWPMTFGLTVWALVLFPYGDSQTQGQVGFFMAVSLLSSLYCLMHAPTAMLAMALLMGSGFILRFSLGGPPAHMAMAVNMMVVLPLLVLMMLRHYREFTGLVHAHVHAQALGAENLRLANLDPLTGLPNRRAFFTALEEACQRAQRNNSRFAVALLDLDGFKPVNDLHGHATGDQLLVQVGERLAALAGGRFHVARLGGDEFGLVLEGLEDDAAATAFAHQVCARMQAPFTLQDISLQVAASMGLVVYPDLAGNAVDLYECADYALYEGKRSTRGGVSLFSTGHHRRIQHDAAIEQALRGADLHTELSVVFQPIVDIHSHATVGFEALARWHSPALGLVPPADFIPVAERMGLVTQLTRVLLAKALAEAVTWPEDVGLSITFRCTTWAPARRCAAWSNWCRPAACTPGGSTWRSPRRR